MTITYAIEEDLDAEEIVDVLNSYLLDEQLTNQKFNRGVAWLDTGTPESLLEAALFVETIEKLLN